MSQTMNGCLTPNSFSSYFLNEDDALEGSILSTLQKKVIHNLLVARAEEKLALELDPNNVSAYLQHEASLAGEISAYRSLIENSEVADEQKNPKPDTNPNTNTNQ